MKKSNETCGKQAAPDANDPNPVAHPSTGASSSSSPQDCCNSQPNSQEVTQDKLQLSTTSCCGGSTDAELPMAGISQVEPLMPGLSTELHRDLPVVVIGAGPVGLAAAANLVERKQSFLVLESGGRIAASMRQWQHVRLFTPWSYLIDPAGKRLLVAAKSNWIEPDGNRVPDAREFVEKFLDPLASHRDVAANIRLNHKVVSISREGHDRMKDGQRSEAPFLIVAETPEGPKRLRARAVIDASGTWTTPNPLGAGGIPADGELHSQSKIQYGMPDILGRDRQRYSGKRVLVVGSGHSATGNILSLLNLAEAAPETSIIWGIRRSSPTKLWGGGSNDDISERGLLGIRAKEAVDAGRVTLLTDLSVMALQELSDGLEIIDGNGNVRTVVDEIIVSAGARPDLAMLRELRLEFDPATEAARSLGPLIDPNHHSCGSVPPHGAAELRQPENGFYLAGMKSYGRAPTFLLMTGYEQVRSIVAEIAGDCESARKVQLTLPSTGVCSTDLAFSERTSTSN